MDKLNIYAHLHSSQSQRPEINICLRHKGLIRSWKKKQIAVLDFEEVHHRDGKVVILPSLIVTSEFNTNEHVCWFV